MKLFSRQILDDLDLDLPVGQVVAIVGGIVRAHVLQGTGLQSVAFPRGGDELPHPQGPRLGQGVDLVAALDQGQPGELLGDVGLARRQSRHEQQLAGHGATDCHQ